MIPISPQFFSGGGDRRKYTCRTGGIQKYPVRYERESSEISWAKCFLILN